MRASRPAFLPIRQLTAVTFVEACADRQPTIIAAAPVAHGLDEPVQKPGDPASEGV
jgi:hypothetical protein